MVESSPRTGGGAVLKAIAAGEAILCPEVRRDAWALAVTSVKRVHAGCANVIISALARAPRGTETTAGNVRGYIEVVKQVIGVSPKDRKTSDALIYTASLAYSMLVARAREEVFAKLVDLVDSTVGFKVQVGPRLPLKSLIDDVSLFLPDGPDADVFIEAKRDDVYGSSFRAINIVSHEQWRTCQVIDVCYVQESGYGVGVVRDWFTSLAQEVFGDPSAFARRENGTVHPLADAPAYKMRFAGKVLGFALKCNLHTSVPLSRASLRMMATGRVILDDLREVAPDVFKSCVAMACDAGPLDMFDGFVGVDGSELFAGSSLVTLEKFNQAIYGHMVGHHYLTRSQGSCDEMMEGAMHVLACAHPAAFRDSLFHTSPEELGAIMCGAPAQDNTNWTRIVTHAATCKICDSDEVVKLFFDILRGMAPPQRHALLRFWTGTTVLPSDGDQQLMLEVDCNPNRMPSARTCCATLRIPYCTDATKMKALIEEALAHNTLYDD